MPHVTPLHADDPQRVGRYRLIGRIAGTPAGGSVYLGSTPDGGEVAIKLLDADWDGAARDRFTAEAKGASRVAPFCAAQILGAGFEGDQAYLVSEYVDGPSLQEFVAEAGPWEGRDLVALAIGTATGLAAIHQAGLVHGDFGPEHVVLGTAGPRVVGFGITPPYGLATPAADLRAWVYTVLYAAAGEAADPQDPENLDLLPEPLRTLAVRCFFAESGGQPTARSIVLELLGDDNPPAGVLGEGMRRAARAAVRPLAPSAADSAPPEAAQPRTRARAVWWAAAVAACLLAIVAVILFVQHQDSQSPDAAKSPAADGSAAASPSARPPTPRPADKSAAASPSAGPPAPALTVPAALAGTWSGQVSQTGPADVFQAEVILTAGASQGSVHYSGGSFACTGRLTPVSDSSGTLTLDQVIVQGPCAGGVVTLSPDPGNAVQFRFKGKEGPMATGTLTRS
jgi:eukaryotic-like serine/threonine-protein kinase